MIKTGIYFKDYNWAKNYFSYLLETTKDIVYTQKNNHKFFIQYANKDTVTFVVANDSARGYRFDKMYLQEGIDLHIYNCIIAPKLIHRYPVDDPIQIIKEQNNSYLFIPIDEYYRFEKDNI